MRPPVSGACGLANWSVQKRSGRTPTDSMTKGTQAMYAVFESGGKQHRVEPGEVLNLEKLDVEAGGTIYFDRVMLVGEGDDIKIGTPFVDGGKVSAEVLSHGRGKKVTIIKMRRRKHYRRQAGHRQAFTQVKIKEISGG